MSYEKAVKLAREYLDHNASRSVLGLPLRPVRGMRGVARIAYEHSSADMIARHSRDPLLYDQMRLDTALQLRRGVALSPAQYSFVADVLEAKRPPRKRKSEPRLLIYVLGSAVDVALTVLKHAYRNDERGGREPDTACDAVVEAAATLGYKTSYNIVRKRYRRHLKLNP